jgi:hypothetical protein
MYSTTLTPKLCEGNHNNYHILLALNFKPGSHPSRQYHKRLNTYIPNPNISYDFTRSRIVPKMIINAIKPPMFWFNRDPSQGTDP